VEGVSSSLGKGLGGAVPPPQKKMFDFRSQYGAFDVMPFHIIFLFFSPQIGPGSNTRKKLNKTAVVTHLLLYVKQQITSSD